MRGESRGDGGTKIQEQTGLKTVNRFKNMSFKPFFFGLDFWTLLFHLNQNGSRETFSGLYFLTKMIIFGPLERTKNQVKSMLVHKRATLVKIDNKTKMVDASLALGGQLSTTVFDALGLYYSPLVSIS